MNKTLPRVQLPSISVKMREKKPNIEDLDKDNGLAYDLVCKVYIETMSRTVALIMAKLGEKERDELYRMMLWSSFKSYNKPLALAILDIIGVKMAARLQQLAAEGESAPAETGATYSHWSFA